jgi:hypothetical protein
MQATIRRFVQKGPLLNLDEVRPNIALNRTRRARVFFFRASVAAGRLA